MRSLACARRQCKRPRRQQQPCQIHDRGDPRRSHRLNDRFVRRPCCPPTDLRVGGFVGGKTTGHALPRSCIARNQGMNFLHSTGFASLRCIAAQRPAPLELLSGRQDLNLRPPGPQPERWGIAGLMGPMLTGSSAAECLSVALNLFPRLFPKRMFALPLGRDASPISPARAASDTGPCRPLGGQGPTRRFA